VQGLGSFKFEVDEERSLVIVGDRCGMASLDREELARVTHGLDTCTENNASESPTSQKQSYCSLDMSI
jgi:hypothetical protein